MASATTVVIGLADVSVDDVVAVAEGAAVQLAPEAIAAMSATHTLVATAVTQGRPIYGLTTGVGDLYTVALAAEDIASSQLNLLRSHASGVGEPHSVPVVRAIMLAMTKALARGASGVSPRLVEVMAEMLNRGVTPWAPSQGSVGYLVATAHIGLAVFGHGRSWFDGELLDGAEALGRAGIEILTPGLREGHAMLSGTYEISGIGALAVADARRTVDLTDVAAALSLEALRGNTRGYDERVHALRPHPGQVDTAARLRSLLADSEVVAANADQRLQDPLSLRSVPQVHGSARDVIGFVERVVEIELNSVTDNPAFVVEDGMLVPLVNGNGHGAPPAVAMDLLAIVVAEVGSMSQARSDRLTNRHLSGLPPFLVEAGGVNSGYMIPPYVAAALSGENRGLAAPATVHTVPTCAGQEDHISMGVAAAVQARAAVDNLTTIVAVELLCAVQGVELQLPLRLGRGTAAAYDAIRSVVPTLVVDREMWVDIAAIRQFIDDGTLASAVDGALA